MNSGHARGLSDYACCRASYCELQKSLQFKVASGLHTEDKRTLSEPLLRLLLGFIQQTPKIFHLRLPRAFVLRPSDVAVYACGWALFSCQRRVQIKAAASPIVADNPSGRRLERTEFKRVDALCTSASAC